MCPAGEPFPTRGARFGLAIQSHLELAKDGFHLWCADQTALAEARSFDDPKLSVPEERHPETELMELPHLQQ